MDDDRIEAFKRCYHILVGAVNSNELIEIINKSTNEEYTKEQCYEDIFKAVLEGYDEVIGLIKHVIYSDNKEDIDIILKNIKFLDVGFLSQLLEKLKNDEKCKEFFKNKIKNGLISTLNLNSSKVFYDFLKTEEDGPSIIRDKFEEFFSDGYDFRFTCKIMTEIGISLNRVLERKSEILKNSYGENIILFIRNFYEMGLFDDNDIELEDFVKALHSDVDDKTSLKILEIFYKEFLDKQNLNIKDIQILGKGGYSKSYRIGQFVFKIGKERKTEIIPYHKRILQPLLRQNTNPNGENNFYIEIQNVVDTDWYKDMTEEQIQEELYKIYKEMREDGIVWTDIKKENIGRLIKPNRTNYYTETLEGNIEDEKTLRIVTKELEVSDDAVGIVDRKLEKCLEPGELVILDSDFIFRVEDIDFENEMKQLPPARYIRFEQRYRYELAQEKEER